MACKLNKGANMAEQPGTVEQTEQTQNTASPTQTGQGSTTTTQNTISNEELKKQLDIIDEKVSKHNSFVLNSFEASFDFASEEEKDINLADGLTVPNAKKISRKVDEKIAQVDTKILQVDTKIEEFESYKLDKTLELDETKAKVQSVEDTLNTKANINGSENQTFKVREAQLEDEATPLKQVNLKLAQIKGELKGELKTELIDNLGQGSESRRFRVANATEGKDAVNLELLNQRLLTVQGSGGSGTIDPEVLNSKANLGGNENQKFRVATATEDNEAVNKAQLEEVKTIAEQRALLEGSETQTFKVATAVEDNEAVNKAQLDSKANLAGNENQKFKVANAVEDNDAVNFGQMSTSILTRANVGGSASQIFKVADATGPNDAVNLKVLNQKIGLAGGVEAIQEDIITRNFSDDSAVGVYIDEYPHIRLLVLTKRGDILMPHPKDGTRGYLRARTSKPYIKVKKVLNSGYRLFLLYEDGQLMWMHKENFMISLIADNVYDFWNISDRIIYTKRNSNYTYGKGIDKVGYHLGSSQIEVVVLKDKANYAFGINTRNIFFKIGSQILKIGDLDILNSKSTDENASTESIRDYSSYTKLFDNLTDVKEVVCFDLEFCVLTYSGKIIKYISNRDRNSDPIRKQVFEPNNGEKVETIFPNSIFQGYKYTNKKRFMPIYANLVANTYRNELVFSNVERSELKSEYGVPVIEKNNKKYHIPYSVESLVSVKSISSNYLSFEGDKKILQNYPDKEQFFKTFISQGDGGFYGYINKQGEVYITGRGLIAFNKERRDYDSFTKVYPFN